MKTTLISLLLVACCSFSKGQIALIGNSGYNLLFGGGFEYSNLGFNLQAEYDYNDDMATFTGGISYFLPKTVEGYSVATAASSTTYPTSVQVRDETCIPLFALHIGYKRYLVGAMDDNFNFYGTAQVGLLGGMFTYRIDETSYNKSAYNMSVVNYNPSIPGSRELLSNATLALGPGVEFGLSNNLWLCIETKLVIPATSYNSRSGAGEYAIPAGLQSFAGIKYFLD